MSDLVTITVDGIEVSVPSGTLVVDAAKRIGNDIPVFCYHPKMKPVGMCRMCLVDIGTPMRDRATGDPILNEDGTPKIQFGRALQTGCTVPVSPGMVVTTNTDNVTEARKDVLEFLLTSHPLDCPICDKGGECPLQNLTMRHGPGTSRFSFAEKMKMDKHVPLGDLIYLDRERCIQCARCTRFQDEIVADPVIAFHNRGRSLEIVTLSDPGFDSYWSGNTTDICPVGALTTADFRFGARPWELTPVASVCPHCAVGCNTTMSTRREASSGGRQVIKRIMPRQNEAVNEIWICDKGRFGHHFADSADRLTTPLLRKNGTLTPVSWDEALTFAATELGRYKGKTAALTNARLTNEDLYQLQKLVRTQLESNDLDIANRRIGGGAQIAQVGLASGSNLKDLGPGDAILVVASDLHEEAPVWWLRVKQAADERGVNVTTLNARPTRLDQFANQTLSYQPGNALSATHKLLNALKVDAPASEPLFQAASAIAKANNLVIFYGSDGLTYDDTETLSKLLANILLLKKGDDDAPTQHVGRPNNGLVAVWPKANSQGAWDLGVHPAYGPGYTRLEKPGKDANAILSGIKKGSIEAAYLVGADPVGDQQLTDRGQLKLLIVQELFLTETAKLADLVLPAQSWAEREGTYTNGERRIQRFYPAIPVVGESRADWQISAQIAHKLGGDKPAFAPSLLFRELTEATPIYAGIDYRTLAQVEKQWPDVGGEDLYYGGNAYQNSAGLGQQWASASETTIPERYELDQINEHKLNGLALIQGAALYTPGQLLQHTQLLNPRMEQPMLYLHDVDAAKLNLVDGDLAAVELNGRSLHLPVHVNGTTNPGVALVRGIGSNDAGATVAKISKLIAQKENK